MNDPLRAELQTQAAHPPNGDIRIEAFCQALLKVLSEPGLNLLKDELNALAEVNPSYAVNKALRIFQKHLIALPDYPKHFSNYHRWITALTSLCNHEILGIEIMHDLKYNDVQSNVVERYKSVKLIMHLFSDRLGDSPRVLDAGCSRNHGLKKLKMNLKFMPIGCGLSENRTLFSSSLNECFNRLIDTDICLGQSVGSDIVDLNSYGAQYWAKSCSFYPSELLNEAAVAEYQYLDNQQVSGVSFSVKDFSREDLKDKKAFHPYDVIIASTFLYQLPGYQRQYAYELLRNSLSQSGIIIYQDFVTSHNGSLSFETDWFDLAFPYRTLIEFGDDPTHKLYEFLRWENGRCCKWVPGKDMDSVLNNKTPMYINI